MNHVFTLQWLNVDSGQLTTSFLAVSLPLPASVKDDASFTIALSFPIRIAHCWSFPPHQPQRVSSGHVCKSVNYTYMPTRMIEETFFLSCYMCGCSKFGAKIFVALKFELPKTQVVQ